MSERKVAVVVGVGPGLGAAVAHRFAREGFTIALVARSETALASVRTAITNDGGRAISIAADATDPKAIGAAFGKVRSELGAASVLVHNASTFVMASILEITPEQIDASFRTSCAGALYAIQAAAPDMLAAKRGTILLTGATASLRGAARFGCLAAGKFALRAIAQSAARELAPQGVHVAHVIIDGGIDTPRSRAMVPGRDPSTLLAPSAIAETYWQLHAQDPSAWTHEIDLRPSVEKF